MGIETALKTHLDSELSNDVNLSGISIYIYPHVAPKNASFPFINYQILSSTTEDYLNSNQVNLTLTDTDIDLVVFSESVIEREKIMLSLKTILHGFSGSLGTELLNIRNTILQSVSTFSESDLTGSDEQIYRANLTFNFTYNWS